MISTDPRAKDLAGDPAGPTLIRTLVERIAINHQGEEGMLRALGIEDRLVAVGGHTSWDDEIRGQGGARRATAEQRVMIARAIAQSSSLLILDEITAFLDLPGRVEVMALLRRHARATGAVVLLSSHDLDLSL